MMPLTSVFLALVAVAQDDAQVRKAVERSLPYLEKEGLAWIQKRDCLSCHQVPFMLWAHQEAQNKGIAVDLKKLADWNDWSLKESLKQRVRVKLTEQGLQALVTLPNTDPQPIRPPSPEFVKDRDESPPRPPGDAG